MKWHKVEITFSGLSKCEIDATTFTDNRLVVEFARPDNSKFWVAGFFAGGGNEADTGNGCGNKWRVRLNPDMEGQWNFQACFRTGTWVVVAPMISPDGTEGTAPDGEIDTFVTIHPTNKNPFERDLPGQFLGRYERSDDSLCQRYPERNSYTSTETFRPGGCE